MIYWNADPIAVSVGPLSVHWYGIFFAAAFIVGLQIMGRMFAREGRSTDDLDSLLGFVVVGALVGARLGHCLLYDPVYYLSTPLLILKIWEGGLASHGGVIGILVAVGVYARRSGMRFWWLLDRIAVPAAQGGAFIRIGNFMNSEIVGMPTIVPWAVIFERLDPLPRHPVQLYEAAAYLLIFIVLLLAYRVRDLRDRQGLLAGTFLALVFAARFVLEFYKMPQAAYEYGQFLTVGQWLSVPCVLVGFWLLFRAFRGQGQSTKRH
ncbi:prolipoprotein diacylglyceryl transferase [Desulfomicrobium norvegicum]|uniref:Phosphatidylglycerol--prolipoprotein diacylglyceryl transferase n=1 Tax=Desulfomicrobium norvegicum (strain DSM 1741 / NCIMB 8310) TaxID=52561 RepID=A0A8G2C3T1_DESNO|nr:prolipoprotein diacylglyceryl transferase [Desulfomicrobium norvegicum]SFL86739.1 prolipoprotein diacylglyceryl transferase [Desulfomicrobium norvegicum]